MTRVIGYRTWIITEDGKLGPNGFGGEPWKPGLNTAECKCDKRFSLSSMLRNAQHHPPAQIDGTCGFWSYFEPESAYAHLHTTSGFGLQVEWERIALGVILGGGSADDDCQVCVHEDGFRTQYAEIVALAHSPYLGVGKIAAEYGVPYVAPENLLHVAREHGGITRNEIPEEGREDRVEDRVTPMVSNPWVGGYSCPQCGLPADEVVMAAGASPVFTKGVMPSDTVCSFPYGKYGASYYYLHRKVVIIGCTSRPRHAGA